jgi:hypothetical protein
MARRRGIEDDRVVGRSRGLHKLDELIEDRSLLRSRGHVRYLDLALDLLDDRRAYQVEDLLLNGFHVLLRLDLGVDLKPPEIFAEKRRLEAYRFGERIREGVRRVGGNHKRPDSFARE